MQNLDDARARVLERPERPVVGGTPAQLAALPPELARTIEARPR